MLRISMSALLFATGCASDGKDTAHHHHNHSDIPADANFSQEATTEGGTWALSYQTVPEVIELSENFSVVVSVRTEDGLDTEAKLNLLATMPAHDHAMNTEPIVTPNGDGTFDVGGMLFHMTGHWRIDVSVESPDKPAERAWFDTICCS